MYKNETVIDAHVHCAAQCSVTALADFLTCAGTERANINACSHSRCLSLAPQALILKNREPGRFFVFAAPEVSAYYFAGEKLGETLRDTAARYLAMGCDGVKLLEGKPQMRKLYPIPDFDAPCWEAFWQWVEENAVPILWHVNDPENFWDRENAPSFAVAQGWLYDESYINNEVQYAQVIEVLRRHPYIKVCFAHFFFLSAQLDRLDSILSAYPNVTVDLTPGIEMYENFSADPERTAAFFAKWSRRILYGTDIGGRCILMGEHKEFDGSENRLRPELVRYFLGGEQEREITSDGHYLIGRAPFVMRPLGLTGEKLGAILGGNFLRFAGCEPRAVVPEAVLEECAILRRQMGKMAEAVHGYLPDESVIRKAEREFS